MSGAVADRISMSIAQNFGAAAILCLCGLFVAPPNPAQESPDEITLAPGYGYLFIRLIFPSGDEIGRFEMTNLGTGDVIKTRPHMYQAAGQNAWMGLIALPEGRYFWSEFEPSYRFGLEESRFAIVRRKSAPRTASDTFEIAPGVINYAGDWVMQFTTNRQNPNVSLNKKTLERLVESYPEHIKRYEIHLSMMGKQAISLTEFLKLVEEHSDSENK